MQKDVTEVAPAAVDLEKNAGEDEDKREESTAIHVIAEVLSRKTARIHLRQGCYRARGLAFKSYELAFEDPPPASSFTDF